MANIRVFLDTSVLVRYLQDGTPENLLAPTILENITFVINPVVLQELLLESDRTQSSINWKQLIQHFEVDTIDGSIFENSDVKYLLQSRNRTVHSSDFLIMASATTSNCDYLLTYDHAILKAVEDTSYRALTPEDFASLMEESA